MKHNLPVYIKTKNRILPFLNTHYRNLLLLLNKTHMHLF